MPSPHPDPVFTRERLVVYPSAILLISVAVWLVAVVGGDLPAVMGGEPVLPDFLAYWTGGHLFVQGDLTELYDPQAQFTVQHEIVPEMSGMSWFVAPPLVAVAYAPLGLLPYPVAAMVFLTLSIAVVAACGHLLASELAVNPRVSRRLALLGLAAAPPVFEAVGSGQNSPMLLLCWLLATRCARNGREPMAGVLLALAAFKPHLALLVPVLLVCRRRWGALAAFTVTLAAGLLATWAIFGVSTVRTWIHTLAGDTFGAGVSEGQTWKMESIGALLLDVTGLGGTDVPILLVGAIVLACWTRRTTAEPLGDMARLALVTVLCAPHVMLYDGVLLLITAAWLAAAGHLWRARWALLVTFVVMFTTSIRHLVADAVRSLAALDWAWSAVPLLWLLVVLFRVSDESNRPRASA